VVEKMKSIQDLGPSDIMSVYSGKAHRCCCGCSGKHSYNESHAYLAGVNRGYPVSEEEINNRMVTKVLRLIQANEEKIEKREPSDNHVAVIVGTRIYVAYYARVS
jgi:hypothetical protein